MAGKYGFWTLTFLVIANMIGAGVFTTSGFALQDLRSPSVVIAAWVAGGLVAIAGAVSYGMLARLMPQSGGEYLFLSRAAHPLLGYIAGWVSLIAGFSGAIAFAAAALESYVAPDRLRPEWLPAGSVAVAVIVVAGAFHGLRPRLGSAAQNGAVILKLLLLAAILGFAAYRMTGDGRLMDATSVGVDESLGSAWALAAAFAGSLVWISLSYSGFNAAVYVAGEVEDAQRVVPKALVAGTAVVAILYVLLNTVFVLAPPAADIMGKPDVAAIAASALGGSSFAAFVRWTIALCLMTSVLSMMMAAPRVYAKMADDGLMPHWMRFRGEAPAAATVVQVGLAIFLIVLSNLQGLLSYLGLTLSLSAACSVCCLFLPAQRRESTAAAAIYVFPAFYVLATVVSAAIMTYRDPWQLAATALTFLVGVIAYAVTRRRQSSTVSAEGT